MPEAFGSKREVRSTAWPSLAFRMGVRGWQSRRNSVLIVSAHADRR